jgi:alkanesulfonate monooxygenase SsuD/methylene tetrahydromethanopterin reductase-like flavin-dependent oxidoreductase (luciferase family)
MELAIGLPNPVPDTTGRQLTDWARAVESAGFSSLGTIDRIVYPNYEPLIALAAAAAVTDHIRLATSVVLGPLRMNAALLAKQILSLDALGGGGRAVLGISVGAREDDYEISYLPMSGRGEWLDAGLKKIRAIWNGQGELESKVGPRPQGDGPSLLVGGYVDAAFKRVARYGDGWIQGGAPPEQFAKDSRKVEEAWKAEGREGAPSNRALAYFSLGPDAEQNAKEYLLDYYAWLGDETSQMIVGGAAKDPDTVKQYMSAYEDAGCDELFLMPCSSDPQQVSLLAQAAGL